MDFGAGMLAQTLPSQPPPPQAPAIIVGVICLVGLVVAAVWGWRCQRRRHQANEANLADLFQEHGFHRDETFRRLPELQPMLGRLQSDTLKSVTHAEATDLYHRRLSDLQVDVLRLDFLHQVRRKTPMAWSEFRKVLVCIHGFRRPLPVFRLMPNHWVYKSMYKRRVFATTHPFGAKNLVLSDPAEADAIRQLFDDDIQAMLMNNREWAMESVGPMLVIHVHDDREQPRCLDRLIVDGLVLAEMMNKCNERIAG